MKKLLAILMAVMMLMLPLSVTAENFEDLDEMIGGADLETDILLTDDADLSGLTGNKALEAGRRINSVLTVKELKGLKVGEASIDAAIEDLFAALGLAFYQQGEEAGMALQLSGKDVLTLAGAASGEDFYLNSNLLGGTVVVSAQEIEPLLSRLVDMLVMMDVMSAREAEEIKTMMAQVFDEMEASMNSTMESVMAMQDLENLDFSAFESLLPIMMENLEIVEASVVPRMCDTAAGGVKLSIDNAEFAQILKAVLTFIRDNPVMMDCMAATGEFSSEAEMIESINEAYASVDEEKFLDGELTIALYTDDSGMPVYGLMNLPMHDNGKTEVLEIIYTRQTVAAGVAHVCNITIDGRTVTIDALATEANTVINMTAAEGWKAMDIVITNIGESALKAELNAYEDNAEKIFAAQLDGEWEKTETRNYLSGKLAVTVYEGVPGGETIVFTVSSDYAVDGVDYSGAADVSFEFEGVGMTLNFASATADPEESIMAGNVVRPAELDDAAFQNWFVEIISGAIGVFTNAMMSLPASVMKLIQSSGMI